MEPKERVMMRLAQMLCDMIVNFTTPIIIYPHLKVNCMHPNFSNHEKEKLRFSFYVSEFRGIGQ